jgi:hypothetical protein
VVVAMDRDRATGQVVVTAADSVVERVTARTKGRLRPGRGNDDRLLGNCVMSWVGCG